MQINYQSNREGSFPCEEYVYVAFDKNDMEVGLIRDGRISLFGHEGYLQGHEDDPAFRRVAANIVISATQAEQIYQAAENLRFLESHDVDVWRPVDCERFEEAGL